MKTISTFGISLIVLFSGTTCPAQGPVKWYEFDRDFISARYQSDSAIGTVEVTQFHPAANVHNVSCGGDDAELHIGILIGDVDLPNDQTPLGQLPTPDQEWGIVAELPNAKLANGPTLLKKLLNKSATFEGYFRVWDEGHAVGVVHPSNPHHVFEIHPAWGFSGTNVTFSQPKRVNSIAGYSGYGAQKFKPLLKSLSDGIWPLAYQKDGKLSLGLVKAQNFYQLPVRIKSRTSIHGGHKITMDVFSDKHHTNLIYSDLAGITVTGSPFDSGLVIGQETFLLGFFSVNLRKAMNESNGFHSLAQARAVPGAVEFFIFGPALKSAVQSCN